jgi:hypothetical protein
LGPGWTPEPARKLWSRETSLVLVGNKITIFGCPIRRLVTIPTELSRIPHQILLQWQAGKWKIQYEIVVGKPEERMQVGDIGTTGITMMMMMVIMII